MKKDLFLISLGLGTTAFLGFIYTVIMARVLGPASFGTFSAIISLVAITFSLGDLGIGPAIINFLPKLRHKQTEIVQTGYWLEYFTALVILVILWSLAIFSSHLIPGALPVHFVLVGSLSFNYILIGYAQSIFTANRMFGRFSLSQIIDAVIKIILVLGVFFLGELSISTALIANVISTLISLLLTFWSYLWQIEFGFYPSISKVILSYSKWIAVSRIFSVLISRIDILLLNLLASGLAAGIFAAASRITLLFAILISSLGTVINPHFSNTKSTQELKKYLISIVWLPIGICLITAVVILLADPLINYVFGPSYQESVFVFRWLAVSMTPFIFSVLTTGALLYSFGEAKFYSITTALQVSIMVIVDILLIPYYGAFAPVISTGIANLVFLGLSVAKLRFLIIHDHLSKRVVPQYTNQSL